jgi:GNAT superfamily N-acetyltransferase
VSASERQARALMERVLRGGGSLADEYPLVFGARAAGELCALEEQGQVRAACALLVRELVCDRERLRVGLIGSVCTHEAHRGRGLGGRLLERAEARLAELGCTLAWLWADDAGFYERRGWRRAGCEVVFALERAALAGLARDERARVRAAAPDDFAALHRLYEGHAARVDRTLGETRALLGSGGGVGTLVLERGRDVVAYACLGRGADLLGCLHEWAGAPDDVLRLAREHLERTAHSALYLMSPDGALVLRERLAELGVAAHAGVLGMAKLLDAAAATDLVRRAARGLVAAGLAARRDEAVTHLDAHFAGPAGALTLAPHALLDLLVPARHDRSAIAALERATGTALPTLPLPIYLWGLDSI